MFFKVHGSKEMGCCIYISCSENDGTHDFYALLEKKFIVTKNTPLVITVHLCCNVR